MEEKQELRKLMRERRDGLSVEARQLSAQKLACALLKDASILKAISKKTPIAVYFAVKSEISLSNFIVAAKEQGAVLCAPRWQGDSYELAEVAGELVVGRQGIKEPANGSRRIEAREVSVWLVPGLAFTVAGYRLGYGGGWYDRLLAKASPAAVKFGVGFREQLVKNLPVENFDIALTKLWLF